MLLSAFQTAERFTGATRRRYASLAAELGLVAALGVGMDPEPAPGVRGARLSASDPIGHQWDVVVVSAHFAGALVARDLGDAGPDLDRRFDYAITYDRELVLRAARSLMDLVAPAPSPA